MNTKPRTPSMRDSWMADQAAALERLATAALQAEQSNTTASRERLRSAVDAARDAGVGWTKIGDTLGIASGNAYQRYRKRPSS